MGPFGSLVFRQVPCGNGLEVSYDGAPSVYDAIFFSLGVEHTPHAIRTETFMQRRHDRLPVEKSIGHLLIRFGCSRPQRETVLVKMFFEILAVKRVEWHGSLD